MPLVAFVVGAVLGVSAGFVFGWAVRYRLAEAQKQARLAERCLTAVRVHHRTKAPVYVLDDPGDMAEHYIDQLHRSS